MGNCVRRPASLKHERLVGLALKVIGAFIDNPECRARFLREKVPPGCIKLNPFPIVFTVTARRDLKTTDDQAWNLVRGETLGSESKKRKHASGRSGGCRVLQIVDWDGTAYNAERGCNPRHQTETILLR